jgi:rare lipoprotein A
MTILRITSAALALSFALASQGFAQSASAPAAPAAAAAPAASAPAAAAPAAKGDASEGKLAYYGRKFAGRKTASGERFNPNAMTMAHKTLPFGTLVKVTNLATKRSVVLRVNDRGPSTPDRVGDVTVAAAKQLRMLKSGVVNAKLEVVGQAKKRGAKKMAKAMKK